MAFVFKWFCDCWESCSSCWPDFCFSLKWFADLYLFIFLLILSYEAVKYFIWHDKILENKELK